MHSFEDPSLSYNSGTGVLTLNYVNNEALEHQSIKLSGIYNPSDFVLVQDQNGGTDVLYQPTASVTVLTSDGLNFQTNPNPLTEMGSGTDRARRFDVHVHGRRQPSAERVRRRRI